MFIKKGDWKLKINLDSKVKGEIIKIAYDSFKKLTKIREKYDSCLVGENDSVWKSQINLIQWTI